MPYYIYEKNKKKGEFVGSLRKRNDLKLVEEFPEKSDADIYYKPDKDGNLKYKELPQGWESYVPETQKFIVRSQPTKSGYQSYQVLNLTSDKAARLSANGYMLYLADKDQKVSKPTWVKARPSSVEIQKKGSKDKIRPKMEARELFSKYSRKGAFGRKNNPPRVTIQNGIIRKSLRIGRRSVS